MKNSIDVEEKLKKLGGTIKFQEGEIFQVGFYHGKYDVETFEILDSIATLRQLIFYVTDISDNDLAQVALLNNLEFLGLMSCWKITDKGILQLSPCKSLKKLSVLATGVTVDGARNLARVLPSLQIINIPLPEGKTADIVRGDLIKS